MLTLPGWLLLLLDTGGMNEQKHVGSDAYKSTQYFFVGSDFVGKSPVFIVFAV